MASSNTKRFRVSVPESDEVVIAWLANQESVSASLRAIIKEAVRRHGLADVFSSTLPEDMQAVMQARTVSPAKARKQSAQVTHVPKAKVRSRSPSPPVSDEPGISLGADALSDFGIELDLGTFASDDEDGTDDIAAMMSKE